MTLINYEDKHKDKHEDKYEEKCQYDELRWTKRTMMTLTRARTATKASTMTTTGTTPHPKTANIMNNVYRNRYK